MENKKKGKGSESKSADKSTNTPPTNQDIELTALDNPPEDETVELNDKDEAICKHVRKYQQPIAPNKQARQKGCNIKSVKCLACMQAQIASKEDTTANNDSGELWFCMQCFETRCGRYDNQHSLKHYESEPSHCLTLCVSNYTIWCYKCDRYIAQELIKGKLESSLSLAKKVFSNSKKPHSPCRNLSHIDLPIEDTITRNFRVIGLNNLGNTCYFNSALQNLLYLSTFKRELCYTLDRTEFTLVPKKHPNLEPITFSYITNAATAPGALTNALSHLIKQTKIKQHDLSIGKKPHSKKCVISPKEVQQAIAKKHRKFANGSQQDSHELLRFLIDMIKDEEIKRLKVAFLNHFEITEHKTEFKNYPEEKKKLLKKYVSEFKNIFVFTGTFIDDVFGGEILSMVKCHTCTAIFSVNEAFLDISLPLPIEKHPSKLQNPPKSSQTKKGEKQLKKGEIKLSKKEKKRLEKQNSKTMSIQDFQNTSNEHQLTPNIPIPKHRGKSEIEGENTDTTVGDSKEECKDSKEHDKHLTNGMNELNIELSMDVNYRNKHNEDISENTSHPKDDGEKSDNPEDNDEKPDNPEDNDEKSDNPEDNNEKSDNPEDNDEISDNRPGSVLPIDNVVIDNDNITAIESPNDQTQKGSDTDSRQEMEIEHSSPEITEPTDTQPMDAQPTDAQPTDTQPERVKSKDITRLRIPTPSGQDTLEYFLAKFFSPEILYGDYLCIHCNPQLSDDNGDDDKEGSQESIDLSKCLFSDATKQFHIKSLPPILTIHLKRFSQVGLRLQKIGKQISFPLVLDMSPYCVNDTLVARDSDNSILYCLRGIVSHSGGMLGGHYIAYVNIADWSSQVKFPQNDRIETDTADTEGEVPMDIVTESAGASKPTLPVTHPSTHMHNPYEFSTHIQPAEDWYYISDSMVSKVSSEEVFQSQAYILFYERLPLIPK